jgi:hypothetical protein
MGARKAYHPVAVHGRYLCHPGGGTELRADNAQLFANLVK